MASLNSVHIIGNLVRDPEMKYLPNGKAVVDIGVAVNRNYTTESGEKREEVTFIDITAFGRTAEIIAEYAKKGRPVYIGGYLKLDTWDDKTTGQKRSKLKVIGDNIQLLGSKPQGDKDTGTPTSRAPKPDPDLDAPEDDIPF